MFVFLYFRMCHGNESGVMGGSIRGAKFIKNVMRKKKGLECLGATLRFPALLS